MDVSKKIVSVVKSESVVIVGGIKLWTNQIELRCKNGKTKDGLPAFSRNSKNVSQKTKKYIFDIFGWEKLKLEPIYRLSIR